MGEHVEVLRDVSPSDVGTWLPFLEAGSRVVLAASSPGSGEAAREAVAFGLARLVPDLDDEGAIAAAVAQLHAHEVDEADREIALTVLRARADGTDLSQVTRPRVLVVAIAPDDVALAERVQGTGSGTGLELVVWASRAVVRSGRLPASAHVVDLGSAGGAVLPGAIDDALSHEAPRLARGVARRAARRRSNLDVDTWAQRLSRPPAAVLGRWRALDARLRPALVAAAARSDVLRTVDVDVVVASGAGQSLVWRLLRAHPHLEARGSFNVAAVHEIVRRRSRAYVATRTAGD